MEPKIILITGASSGIGETCASYLHGLGHRVYGASRRLTDGASGHFNSIRMDVDSEDSVNQGVRYIFEREGKIDVVVNGAGFGFAGALEDTSIEEAKAQFETNFFGVIRVCRATLPSMRERKSGMIINISSIGGMVSLPFQALYSASKFALEGMTEALRLEVKPYGIRVVLIEPGDFKTEFTANRKRTRASQQNPVYQDRLNKTLSVIERDESNGHAPLSIAHLIERIIENPAPRLRYTVGPLFERSTPLLKSLLPDRLALWMTLKYFDLA